MTTHAIDRRQLLRGLAIGGAGLFAGPLLPEAARAERRLTPFDLHFSTQEQYRPFDLIGPRFVQHEAGARTLSTLIRTRVGPRAPFASVILDVDSVPAGRLAAGLVADQANASRTTPRLSASRSRSGATERPPRRRRSPQRWARRSGSRSASTRTTSPRWPTPAPAGLRSSASGSELTDLRDPATLARYAYGYGVLGGGSIALDGARAGYFGQAGVRDPHVVTYVDGTPLIRHGKVYLTLTQAGLGFFQAAHWGVWTLDLDEPTRLEQVANLFFRRNGVVLGDHAGQIVFDDRRGEFLLAMSGWGDFDFNGVHVHYTRTHANVLSGVHVLRRGACRCRPT